MDIRFDISAGEIEAQSLWPATIENAAAQFHKNGALWVPGAFSKSLISKLRAAYQRHYIELDEVQLARQFAMVGDRRYMINVVLENPFLSPKLYANLLLWPVLENLLGPEFRITSFGSVVAFPGAEAQAIHVDFPPLFEDQALCASLPTYAVTLIVPLVDLDQQTGATQVWPGSHRIRNADEKLRELVANQENDGSVTAYPSSGDAFLMDMRLIHAGTANRSETARPILYIVYSRPWYSDDLNFTEQPPVNISAAQLMKVPKKYRRLFAVSAR